MTFTQNRIDAVAPFQLRAHVDTWRCAMLD
jgi:hypothetical protein